ncbi:MAG: hypothetical protein ACK5RL_16460 [Acidimicrobiales bacterium]
MTRRSGQSRVTPPKPEPTFLEQERVLERRRPVVFWVAVICVALLLLGTFAGLVGAIR